MSKLSGSSNTVSSKFADSNSSIIFSPSCSCGAVELGVRGDRSRHVLHRRRSSAASPRPRWAAAPGRCRADAVLVGVAQQLPGATGERVARGLVAADQEQQNLGDDLVVARAVALDLRVHENTDQIVGRLFLACLDHARHVFVVGREGVHRDLECSGVGRTDSRSSPCRRTTSGTSRVRPGRTPSMSPMTAIGSGAARSRTKSHSPRSHTASMSMSHSEPIEDS